MSDNGSDAWFEKRDFGELTILSSLRFQLSPGFLIQIDSQCESARSKATLAKSSVAWRWDWWRKRGAMMKSEERNSNQQRYLMLEVVLDAWRDPWCWKRASMQEANRKRARFRNDSVSSENAKFSRLSRRDRWSVCEVKDGADGR